jgi:LmbE family N-acetylglucosaminyl deacetylase
MTTSDPPTLLFCFAHPDDESFAAAGTAMKYAATGARIVLVTATLGDRGKAGDPPICAPTELAAYRERELREAVAIIGFDELHLLRYPDRALADAPADEIRRALVAVIRRTVPSVVFTFDPNGFNLHPDHIAIGRFTSDAIAAAADSRWHPDAGGPYIVPRLLWIPPMAPWDAAKCDRLDEQAGHDFILDVSAWRERKIAALRAHRTQHLSVEHHILNQPDPDRIVRTEIWRQAWGPPIPRRPAADVLEDVRQI